MYNIVNVEIKDRQLDTRVIQQLTITSQWAHLHQDNSLSTMFYNFNVQPILLYILTL